MILTQNKSDVLLYGNIQEHKIGIKQEDIKYIITLLSSNLYSKPEESFIREIVSNGWDSHVEADTTDLPIIVKIEKFVNGTTEGRVTIRDFGTGLSKERFEEVFCNIGSSTKRDTNDFIGCFGIGKFSPLACTNTVNITSYYEGVKTSYIMIKDGNNITINQVYAISTEEKNGVEISITLAEKNIDKCIEALDQIVFFPNVYVERNGYNYFKDLQIKDFIYFKDCNQKVKSKILLGNVLYHLNTYILDSEEYKFIQNIEHTGIAIKFDIGEIEVTPNREEIIYSTETIAKINDRIRKAKEELEALIIKKTSKNFDDIYEYYKEVTHSAYYHPLSDSFDNNTIGYNAERSIYKYTYKGKNINKFNLNIKYLLEETLPIFRYYVKDGVLVSKPSYRYDDIKRTSFKAPHFLIIKGNATISKYLKMYILEYYPNSTIISDFTKEDVVNNFKRGLVGKHPYVKEEELEKGEYKDYFEVYKDIYKALLDKAIIIDPKGKELEEYKKQCIADAAQVPIIEDLTVFNITKYGYREKKKYKTLPQLRAWIKSRKQGIILVSWKEEEQSYSQLIYSLGYLCIKVKKELWNELKDMTNIILFEDFKHNNATLRKYKALLTIWPREDMDVQYAKFILQNTTHEKIYSNILNIYSEINNTSVPALCCKPDEYYLKMCRQLNQDIIDLSMCIRNENLPIDAYYTSNYGRTLLTGIILKNKLFRINATAYKKYKNSPLIKLLCKNRIM